MGHRRCAVVTAGNGNNTIGIAGNNNVVTVGNGTNVVSGGAGSDTVTVGGGAATLTFTGWSDHAILNGGTSATIYDQGGGLKIDVASSLDNVTVSGFNQDTSGLIDLLNGAGGYASIGAIMSALHSDGHGGSLLSLGASGSIDVLGVAPNRLTSANFGDVRTVAVTLAERDVVDMRRAALLEKRQ